LVSDGSISIASLQSKALKTGAEKRFEEAFRFGA
jgi:hypothetical protein